jgi:hypothetical protein
VHTLRAIVCVPAVAGIPVIAGVRAVAGVPAIAGVRAKARGILRAIARSIIWLFHVKV